MPLYYRKKLVFFLFYEDDFKKKRANITMCFITNENENDGVY